MFFELIVMLAILFYIIVEDNGADKFALFEGIVLFLIFFLLAALEATTGFITKHL